MARALDRIAVTKAASTHTPSLMEPIDIPEPIVYKPKEIASARKVLDRVKKKRQISIKADVVSVLRSSKQIEEL